MVRTRNIVAGSSPGLLALGILVAGCGVETYRERPPARDLQIRLVADGEGSSLALPRFGHPESSVPLEAPVLVSATHIEHVRLLASAEGRHLLVLVLDDTGRARLREASEAQLGRRLAIVVSGQVIATPRIQTALTETEAYIALPDEDVEYAFSELATE